MLFVATIILTNLQQQINDYCVSVPKYRNMTNDNYCGASTDNSSNNDNNDKICNSTLGYGYVKFNILRDNDNINDYQKSELVKMYKHYSDTLCVHVSAKNISIENIKKCMNIKSYPININLSNYMKYYIFIILICYYYKRYYVTKVLSFISISSLGLLCCRSLDLSVEFSTCYDFQLWIPLGYIIFLIALQVISTLFVIEKCNVDEIKVVNKKKLQPKTIELHKIYSSNRSNNL